MAKNISEEVILEKPQDGEHAQGTEHLLRKVQCAQEVQGDPVQEVRWVQGCPGQTQVPLKGGGGDEWGGGYVGRVGAVVRTQR